MTFACLPTILSGCATTATNPDARVDFGADKQASIVKTLRECKSVVMPDGDGAMGVATMLRDDKDVVKTKDRCLEAAARHIEGVQEGFGK